jgi:hypothetical protein
MSNRRKTMEADTICTCCDEPCKEEDIDRAGRCPTCSEEHTLPEESCVTAEHGAVLNLDNGVTVVCGSQTDDYVAGSYIVVYNEDGEEIGYWDNQEWKDDPVLVMGAAMCCAARGLSADEFRKQQENEDKVSCEGCGEMFEASELKGELGFCEDCLIDKEHCTSCNGTGEGQVDGSHCTSCGGSGRIELKSDDDYDGPDPDEYDFDDKDYGPYGYSPD